MQVRKGFLACFRTWRGGCAENPAKGFKQASFEASNSCAFRFSAALEIYFDGEWLLPINRLLNCTVEDGVGLAHCSSWALQFSDRAGLAGRGLAYGRQQRDAWPRRARLAGAERVALALLLPEDEPVTLVRPGLQLQR